MQQTIPYPVRPTELQCNFHYLASPNSFYPSQLHSQFHQLCPRIYHVRYLEYIHSLLVPDMYMFFHYMQFDWRMNHFELLPAQRERLLGGTFLKTSLMTRKLINSGKVNKKRSKGTQEHCKNRRVTWRTYIPLLRVKRVLIYTTYFGNQRIRIATEKLTNKWCYVPEVEDAEAS